MRILLAALTILLLGTAAARAEETIKLGISAPLSGELAAYGEDVKTGASLAIKDINDKGGVLGKKLEPLFEDDRGDPKTAVTVANYFLTQKVAMASSIMSKLCMAIAPIYAEENVPFLNECNSDRVTAKGWPNVIRVYPKSAQEGPKLAELITLHFKGRKLAFLYAAEEFNNNLAETVLGLVKKQKPLDEKLVIKLPEQGDDYSAIVTRLKHEGADLVYLGMWPKAAGLFIRQAAAAGYHPQFIGNSTGMGDEIVKIAGSASDGFIFSTPTDPRFIPSAQPVVKALAAQNSVNRPIATYYYALIQVYAEAVKQAGTTESDAVLKALKSGTFDTILGKLKFAANGDVQGLDFQYYRWEKGDFAPWQPKKN